MRQLSTFALLANSAAILALAGCSSSTQPVTSYGSLTSAQKQQVDTAIALQVSATVSTFSNPAPSLAGVHPVFARVAALRATGAMRLAGSRARAPFFGAAASCESRTPTDLVDSDADGVVDTVAAQYACDHGDSSGTVSLHGTLNIGDPTPNVADVAYTEADNLTLAITSHGQSLTLATNAATLVTETAGLLSQIGNASLNLAITGDTANNGTVKLTESDTASYAYQGAFLVGTNDARSRAGTFNINGSWGYTVKTSKVNAALSLHVTTPGGLMIDPAHCTNNDGGHIASGTVVLKFSDGAQATATWTGCPTVPSISAS